MTKITKAMRIFIRILSIGIAAFLLFLVVSLFGVRLFGVQVFTVLSGSMEPTYPVGSVIYVKDVDPTELWVGDAVTFETDGNIIVTHRIVSVETAKNDPQSICFITKGDANDRADAECLTMDRIIGKPVFMIPKIGFVADFMHSQFGRMISIALVLLLIFLSVLAEYLKDPEESTC